ncbi:GATL10 [Symbiodinium sp. CCMP2456]|nr:GATL10 [Symbiodinium sp. CCMP2456]
MMCSAKSILYALFLLLAFLPSRAIRDTLGVSVDTVHAFYSADEPSIDGLCASIHSLLVSSSQPQRLVVDVAVKAASIPIFQARFGMDGSLSAATTKGATIQLHALNEAKMNEIFKYQMNYYHERPGLDKSIEKYARLYIDTLLPDSIVVYLDTDVVIQSDVLVLADRLAASGKTMAFVERVPRASLGDYVHADNLTDSALAKLGISRTALVAAENATEYNAGVLVFNTRRWQSLGYLDKVKHWLHINYELHGKLFRGNDQTLLMLSFEVWRKPGDFIVVEREWNVEVHHQLTIDRDFLAHAAKILHFNGVRKPWLPSEAEDPLAKELFRPHLQKFPSLLVKGAARSQLPLQPMLAALVALLCVLLLLALSKFSPIWNSMMPPAESALHVNLMVCFQGFMNYSSVVLCAYPLCLSLNLSNAASMSGLLIGVFMEASAVGMGVSWKILNVYPDLWRRHIQSYLVAGLSCQFFGALAFCKVAMAVKYGQSDSTLIMTLLAARICQGFGHGLNDQFMKCCIVKLAATHDRPRHSLKKFVANTLGIGCGPIVIALAYFFFHDDAVDAGLTNGAQISMLTAQWQLTMTITVLIGAILLYPSLEEVSDFGKANTLVGGHQTAVLLASIFMDALRGFITSGVEAASCLLLQDHFAWRQDSIGFCIGLTFCLVVPGYMLHRQYQARYSDIAWIRIYTGIAMLATALLGTAKKPLGILAADSIIFPSIYLAGALNMGILNTSVFPDGSLLDANNVMLINGIISNGIGRFAGPIFSRSLIAHLGQKAYASCQALAIGSILAASGMLRAPMH